MTRTSGRTTRTTAARPALDSVRFALDRASPVPLYHQLAQQLEAAIDGGVLAPGDLLGNEVDLSGRLGLSRPTVRQAIQSLVDKGLLVRRRGVGTQVVHSRVRRPLELSSLYDDLEAAGQSPTTDVLRLETVPAPAEAAAALGLPEGDPVTVLERLRRTHGRPVAHLCNYLPASLLDLDRARLESTGLYRMVRAAGITLHSAHQTIGARCATEREAALLDETPGAALLTMTRTAYDDTGRAVEYGTHIYRASLYAFDFRLLVRP
ncbi:MULTISPECIES: GntR family transcriptional regulator [unclassified Streptomyces]|uniref:GntR family transcriptional regulator n=1 Tax=unclassified Streptomyces TaxID=2593676 RepID=UPI0027E45877|nr:GntR family transcriptional regulator [Streptomyces sp. XM83C]